jgi:hypothetical protein
MFEVGRFTDWCINRIFIRKGIVAISAHYADWVQPALLNTMYLQDTLRVPAVTRRLFAFEFNGGELRSADVSDGIEDLQGDGTSRTGFGGEDDLRRFGAGEETGREVLAHAACIRGSYGRCGTERRF